MARPSTRALIVLLLAAASTSIQAEPSDEGHTAPAVIASTLPKPPALPPHPVVETYFGTAVTDRYRFVEALDPATLDWMRAQGRYTRGVLDSIQPRAAVLRRMDELGGGFGVVGSVQPIGDRLFFLERAPGRNQFDLLWQGADGRRHTLVDTAALMKRGGKPVSIEHYRPSPDGRRVAVGLSDSGSENARLSVIDVETARTIAGPVFQGAFGGENWMNDGSGLFFSRLHDERATGEAQYLNAEVAWWDLTTDPRVVVGAVQALGPNTDPVRFPFIQTVTGSDNVVLGVANGVQNEVELWTAPATAARDGTATWRKIAATDDQVTGVAASRDQLYFLTHKDAPGFKVTAAPWTGDAAGARTVLPAQDGRVLEELGWAKDGLYVGGRQGTAGALWRVADGLVQDIALPTGSLISTVVTDADRAGVIVDPSGFVLPLATLRWDPEAGRLVDLKLQTVPPLDLSTVRADRLEAVARDGAKVPLAALVPAGPITPRPMLLEAYGAYGVAALPSFNPRRIVLAENGGGYALCSVRGGGELGEAWRLGGKDANKPNTWRDAIACAETLIAKGYTTAAMLTVTGTSAGGIAVGRAATERPDLFAGAISRVGDSNSLRSETMASGPANVPEFGTVKDERGFRNLLAMDSYQAVKDDTDYPAFLLTTGLTDPRVAPWQAAKMAARLQEASSNPVLLRIEEEAGHGMGTTRSTRDEEEADIAAFVFWRAGVPAWQPRSDGAATVSPSAVPR